MSNSRSTIIQKLCNICLIIFQQKFNNRIVQRLLHDCWRNVERLSNDC